VRSAERGTQNGFVPLRYTNKEKIVIKIIVSGTE